jgi:hypothetical protein
MRSQRQQNERKETAKKAKDWKQKTLEQNVKRKLEQESQQKPQGNKQQQQQKQQKDQQRGSQKGVKRKAEAEADAAPLKQPSHPKVSGPASSGGGGGSGFAFPRIEVDKGRAGGSHPHAAAGIKGGKKPSKEQLLKMAEAKQKEKAEEASRVSLMSRHCG